MYDRLELLIGKEKILSLKNKHALVLGLGGVGGHALEALVRSGVGTLTIVDHDTIDITNLNRQIIATKSNIGKYKTLEFKKRINDINPNTKVNVITEFIEEENIDLLFKSDIDFFIDACDSLKTKVLVISKCLKLGIPFITSTGTGNRMDPSKLIITDLKNTSYDPLAKKLRKSLKDNGFIDNITCLCSKEVPLRKGIVIGSNSFVPATAGLLIAGYVINKFLEDKDENIEM